MDGRDQRSLARLADLLLALAELAEHAGTRCLAVRCLVLWILRPAEAVARDYAIQIGGAPYLLVACQRVDDTAGDASRLAQSLRALAIVFGLLACQAGTAPSATPRGCFVASPPSARRPRMGVASPAHRIDTS